MAAQTHLMTCQGLIILSTCLRRSWCRVVDWGSSDSEVKCGEAPEGQLAGGQARGDTDRQSHPGGSRHNSISIDTLHGRDSFHENIISVKVPETNPMKKKDVHTCKVLALVHRTSLEFLSLTFLYFPSVTWMPLP